MSRLNIAINEGRRLAHRVHVRLGANGIAGAVLLVLAVVGLVTAQRAQTESVQLQAQAEQARSRSAEINLQLGETVSPGERLTRFQNWFPTTDTATADLRKIYHAAQGAHVSLDRGEYTVTTVDGSGGLQKFDVVLPVKEHYGAVRSFVGEVLNALPHASLTELRVERSASAADELNTRVHFTLYYRLPAS